MVQAIYKLPTIKTKLGQTVFKTARPPSGHGMQSAGLGQGRETPVLGNDADILAGRNRFVRNHANMLAGMDQGSLDAPFVIDQDAAIFDQGPATPEP
jgi:hypothetical protein